MVRRVKERGRLPCPGESGGRVAFVAPESL